MRRICFFTLLLLATCLSAQSYKDLLTRIAEHPTADRENLYLLKDYQQGHPKEPHPYYLMATINQRLQADEHPLVNYHERSKMLYDARVAYGNCRAFLNSDKVNGTRYPLAANKDGKADEGMVYGWLTNRLQEVTELQGHLDSLYAAYVRMVSGYDECVQLYAQFVGKYGRMKDAQLMMDADDKALLIKLRDLAKTTPKNRDCFEKALKQMPIAGYAPAFSLRAITFYRLEGLTTSDFLQNDIPLWDYAAWVDAFFDEQAKVARLKADVLDEQKRLQKGMQKGGTGKENLRLLNRIRQYDEQSVLADMLHYEWLTIMVSDLEKKIVRDELKEDDWLGCLQMAERHMRLVQECESLESALRVALSSNADVAMRRYGTIIEANWAAAWPEEAISNVRAIWQASQTRLNEWLAAQTEMPKEVQIDETRMVIVGANGLTFADVPVEVPVEE